MNPFLIYAKTQQPQIEQFLRDFLPTSSFAGAERFNEALDYAVFPGGKRLRPLITGLASRITGASDAQGLKLGTALEYIHTSSLIFDDLPGMDDADVRRGRPTLHVVFGEGVAILTAIALLNQAYGLFASVADNSARQKRLIGELTQSIGSHGMVGGQAVELCASGTAPTYEVLENREKKTVALMRLMMISGAIVAGASEQEIATLAKFGEALGRAFQIQDDVLDRSSEELGAKTKGQDLRHRRPSIVDSLTNDEIDHGLTVLIDNGKHTLLDTFGRKESELLIAAVDCVLNYIQSQTELVHDGLLPHS